jgi:hypothetical protein
LRGSAEPSRARLLLFSLASTDECRAAQQDRHLTSATSDLCYFLQRFIFSLVKSPMNRVPTRFRITRIDIADALRASALLLVILMAITFFAGCATHSDVDSNSVIRKREPDNQIHGEAGVSYGRSG